jgi:secondary thiamine-phosphate synthase enzyme
MLEPTTRPVRIQRTPRVRREDTTLVVCEELELETTAAPSFHDITEEVCGIVADAGISFGQVTVYSCHTTAAIRINEHEPLLLRDMARTLRQIAPSDAYYEHNDFGRRTVNMHPDEPANGHSHCQHLFLSTSESIPVIDGKPQLGTYQSIFLIELDQPKLRQVLVTVTGC